MYKFKQNVSNKCKVINIKYCQINLVTITNQDKSFTGQNNEQCIIIRYLKKCIVLSGSQDAAKNVIQRWYDLLKYFCVLKNLRCHYEIGSIIGKGNFAKVYEAINI